MASSQQDLVDRNSAADGLGFGVIERRLVDQRADQERIGGAVELDRRLRAGELSGTRHPR